MRLRQIYDQWISPQRWLSRLGIGIATRLVIGLVLLTGCVLMLARDIRLLPSRQEQEVQSRVLQAQFASAQAAHVLSHPMPGAMDDLLFLVVKENGDVLSAGLRRYDGRVFAQTDDHTKYWRDPPDGGNTPTQIRVGLTQGAKPWGHLEIAFKPLAAELTWWQWWTSPSIRLIVFILGGVYVLFWFFLSRMLTVLDPASVIPNRMQLLMDTLVEGLVILDQNEQIVMTNQSFARTAFMQIDQLLGRKLSSLAWKAQDSSAAASIYPWSIQQTGDLQQRGVSMALQIGTRHERKLNVNTSPILDTSGKQLGTIVTFNDLTVVEEDNIQLSRLMASVGAAIEHLQLASDGDNTEKLEELTRAAAQLRQLCAAGNTGAAMPESPITAAAKAETLAKNEEVL